MSFFRSRLRNPSFTQDSEDSLLYCLLKHHPFAIPILALIQLGSVSIYDLRLEIHYHFIPYGHPITSVLLLKELSFPATLHTASFTYFSMSIYELSIACLIAVLTSTYLNS